MDINFIKTFHFTALIVTMIVFILVMRECPAHNENYIRNEVVLLDTPIHHIEET